MPTIAQAVQNNRNRIETQESLTAPLSTDALLPVAPQDLPSGLGLPQRGMFPNNLVNSADRNDNARVFRSAMMRSATFPGLQPVTKNSTVVTATATTTAPVPTPTPTPTPVTPVGPANEVYATPNGTAGPASLRALQYPDFPVSGVSAGSYTNTNLSVNLEGVITAASNGTISTNGGVGGPLATSYNAQNSDAGQLIVFDTSYPNVTYLLQASGVASDWFVWVENVTSGTVTINPNGLNLDGASSNFTLNQNQGIGIFWDGSNYWTERGTGGGGSGTVTTTGSPSSGNLSKFSGSTSITNADLTGDVTTSGTVATTLATVNSNVGAFTSANITVNAKGLITAAANGSSGGAPFNNMLSPTTITPPVLSALTWGNQGGSGAASLNAGGALYMSKTGSGTAEVTMLYKTAPATPWTFTIGVVPGMNTNASTSQAGIAMRLASSGKIVAFVVGQSSAGPATVYRVGYWTNFTTFSSSKVSNTMFLLGPLYWFRVTNDGTNFTFYTAIDGQNFKQTSQFAVTDFLSATPDEVGICLVDTDSTEASDAVFVHWAGI